MERSFRTRSALSRYFQGALLGLAYFIFDGIGAYFAVPELLDPTFDTAALLGLGALHAMFWGGILVAIVGSILPQGIVGRLASKRTAVIAALGLVVMGFAFRVQRGLLEEFNSTTTTESTPVLFLMVDTLRADTLYGGGLEFPLTPTFAAQAKDAQLFLDAESTAGWTIPSLGALLSGIHNLSFDGSAGRVPSDIPLLPKHLQEAGYASHAVVDNNIVEVRVGFGGGFETYFQRSGYRFAFSLPAFRALPTRFREKLREHLYTSYYGSPGVTAVAGSLLKQHYAAELDKPIFLYVHYMDPHAPYHLHDHLKPDPVDAEPIDYYEFRDILRADISLRPTPGQLSRLLHRYENELRFMDGDLAQLIEDFRTLTNDEGLIILTSDHGEEFLDHGRLGHGSTVYREMVNVPLMIWWPKTQRETLDYQRVENRAVSLLDLTPTILDALDVTPLPSPITMQGESFLSKLSDPTIPIQASPIIASHARNGRRTYRYRNGEQVALMTHYFDDRPSEYEIFRLGDDPKELKNLASDNPELKKDLIAKLTKEIRRLEAAREKSQDQDTEANEEALRALGYIE